MEESVKFYTHSKGVVYQSLHNQNFQLVAPSLNPNTLRFQKQAINHQFLKSLYFDPFQKEKLGQEFKANLISYYIYLTAITILNLISHFLLLRQDIISQDQLILVFSLGSLSFLVSFIVLLSLIFIVKLRIHNRHLLILSSTLASLMLIISDQRILSGLFNTEYNKDGFQTSYFVIGLFILLKNILFDSYFYLFLHILLTLLMHLFFFWGFSSASTLSAVNQELLLVIIAVFLLVDSYTTESRAKNLFIRKQNQPHQLSSLQNQLHDQFRNPTNIIELCQQTQMNLKNSVKMIFFKQTQKVLKKCINNLDIVIHSVLHGSFGTLHSNNHLQEVQDDEQAKFLEQYMNLDKKNLKTPASKLSSLFKWMPLKSSDFPIIQDSSIQVDKIISSVGQNWSFDIWFVYDTTGQSVFIMSRHICQKFSLFQKFNINSVYFQNYFIGLQKAYKNNPYHNACHAADVLHSLIYFLDRGGIIQQLRSIDLFSVIVASLGHDVGHYGVTNRFLVTQNSELAIKYNDQSVQQNMHASLTFALSRQEDKQIFENCSTSEFMVLRKTVIEMILQTDLSKHFQTLGRFKARAINLEDIDLTIEADKILVLSMGLKAADISHTAKPPEQHKKWTELISQEFFLQGDLEKQKGIPVSMFCDRQTANINKSQIGFIKNICLPLFQVWNHYLSSKTIEKNCLKQLKANLEMWNDFNNKTYNSAKTSMEAHPSRKRSIQTSVLNYQGDLQSVIGDKECPNLGYTLYLTSLFRLLLE